VCRGRADKAELTRLVCSAGVLQVDREGRAVGRGAYVHATVACLTKGAQAARWERALRLPPGALGRDQVARVFADLMEMVAVHESVRRTGERSAGEQQKESGHSTRRVRL
jgi:predicted RNA-binding protein YlxR (DUF448 family)